MKKPVLIVFFLSLAGSAIAQILAEMKLGDRALAHLESDDVKQARS
jgi:hypothetical protein